MRPASLLITDGVTITVSKLPDRKFQVAAHAWTDETEGVQHGPFTRLASMIR